MTHWICQTCCTEFPDTKTAPAHCPICDDPRQYVFPSGQQWTSEADLIEKGHTTEVREEEAGLVGIGVTPKAGIGQRALLIEHPDGGVLWDGIPLLDDAAIAEIKSRGGVRAMVMSHPHLYGAMVTNAQKLGGVPIYLPAADRQWTMRPSELIHYFDAPSLDLGHGVTLNVTGGHFDGSAFVHWPQGANGKGVILTGDTILVGPDLRWVSFMWSTPNLVQLGPAAIRKIVTISEGCAYDRLYSGWWGATVDRDAKTKVRTSANRIIARAQMI